MNEYDFAFQEFDHYTTLEQQNQSSKASQQTKKPKVIVFLYSLILHTFKNIDGIKSYS